MIFSLVAGLAFLSNGYYFVLLWFGVTISVFLVSIVVGVSFPINFNHLRILSPQVPHKEQLQNVLYKGEYD